jgi:hypothetical protein
MPETSALGEEIAPSIGIKWTGASCGEAGVVVCVGVLVVVAVGSTIRVGSCSFETGPEVGRGGLCCVVALPGSVPVLVQAPIIVMINTSNGIFNLVVLITR